MMGLVASSSTLLILLSLGSFCVSKDELSPAKPLIFPDNKLISDNGFFALGLFSLTNSSSLFYLGIWYNTDPERTVVWVANRDNPIMDPRSSTLAVTNRSELVLSDGKGSIYWSTMEVGNTTAPSSTGGAAAGGGATAALLNQGNLVLRSSNGTVLWQSYDHPTDTILANMPFRMSYRGPSTGQRLVSWKGPDDPSPGDFSFAGDGLQFLIWHGPNVIWRSPPLNSRMVTSYQPSYPSPAIITALAITGDVVSVTYSTSDGSLGMHARIAADSGNFEFRIWNNATSSWTAMEAVIPGLGCNQYGSCGPFSYCDVSAAVPTCKCPDGFEPSNGTRPSAGCARKERLGCGDGDRFATLPYMKMPATPVFVRNRTFDGCAAECFGNCSCTAYAHSNLTGAISGGDSSRCLMWFGDLVDMTGYGQLTGEDLYLRLGTSSSSVPKNSNFLKILLPITSSVLLAALVALVWTCKYIGTQQKKKTQKRMMMLEYLRTSDDSGGKNIEFPFISFEDIVVATNNFSNSNMLGKGGFGKVYKGILGDTKEVAIKRLSKGSGQGTEEFKNEVVLISKLQHKNLAKLLGCCIQEDEKMLVYEYLPNKSLDYFLFDSARKTMLQWPTRFKIIQGIARGIMYLHHDSRLTIIHRDLKASNILLDKDMSPKISDFGMARIFRGDQVEANTKRVVGTYGYMPHEYAMEGAFSVKSDTYSFGVLLLEIVSGLKISSPHLIMDFPNLIVYAWNYWKDGKIKDFVDSCLAHNCPLDEVSRCIHIGLLCVQDSPDCRPLMSAVVLMLENKTTLLPVPSQPVYFARKKAEPEGASNNRVSTMTVNDLSLTTLEGR